MTRYDKSVYETNPLIGFGAKKRKKVTSVQPVNNTNIVQPQTSDTKNIVKNTIPQASQRQIQQTDYKDKTMTQKTSPYELAKFEADKIRNQDIQKNMSTYQEQSDLINKQKQQNINRLRNILKARTSGIEGQISGARSRFQPEREKVDVRRAQDLQRAREMLSAQGISGGDNLTTQMGINTQASQALSGIDLSQSDYVKNLENEARQLQYAKDADEAQEISRAMGLQRELISERAKGLSNIEDAYTNRLNSLIKARQDQQRDELERYTSNLEKMGRVIDPVTGNIVDTATESRAKRKEDYERQQKRIENLNKYYEYMRAEEEKQAQTERDTYGFNLNPRQRQLLDSFETAMQDPNFSDAYSQAYNAPGGIQSLINEAKRNGRDDLVEALEGGRFIKIMNEGMTEYAGQYSLPASWYGESYETQEQQAQTTQEIAKANVAEELSRLGLQKASNEVYSGNIKNAMEEINLAYLPEEKKQDLLIKIANTERIKEETRAIPQRLATDRYRAETGRMQYQLGRDRFDKSKADKEKSLTDKQDKEEFDTLYDYIINTYSSVGEGNRTVYTEQDVKDIDVYTQRLDQQGAKSSVVDSLRAVFNLPKLPD